MKSVSYIISGYNEEEIIEETVEECVKILSEQFEDFELILIDDDSKDNTAKLMEKAQERYPDKIRFLPNYINLNFGTSILRGFKVATKEYVFYNATDLPLSLNDTNSIVEDMKDNDVLVLERISYKTTKWRKIVSNINIILLRLLFPKLIKGTPILNFTQVFKREAINKVIPLARSPIFIWPEMIFRAKLIGLKVGNRRTNLNEKYNRVGSFGKPHDIIWGLYDMFRFRICLWRKKI